MADLWSPLQRFKEKISGVFSTVSVGKEKVYINYLQERVTFHRLLGFMHFDNGHFANAIVDLELSLHGAEKINLALENCCEYTALYVIFDKGLHLEPGANPMKLNCTSKLIRRISSTIGAKLARSELNLVAMSLARAIQIHNQGVINEPEFLKISKHSLAEQLINEFKSEF